MIGLDVRHTRMKRARAHKCTWVHVQQPKMALIVPVAQGELTCRARGRCRAPCLRASGRASPHDMEPLPKPLPLTRSLVFEDKLQLTRADHSDNAASRDPSRLLSAFSGSPRLPPCARAGSEANRATRRPEAGANKGRRDHASWDADQNSPIKVFPAIPEATHSSRPQAQPLPQQQEPPRPRTPNGSPQARTGQVRSREQIGLARMLPARTSMRLRGNGVPFEEDQ